MSAFKVFPLSLPLAIQVALIEPRTHGDRGVEHFQLPSRVRKSLENSQHGARLFSSRGAGFGFELLFFLYDTFALGPPLSRYVAALIPLSLT